MTHFCDSPNKNATYPCSPACGPTYSKTPARWLIIYYSFQKPVCKQNFWFFLNFVDRIFLILVCWLRNGLWLNFEKKYFWSHFSRPYIFCFLICLVSNDSKCRVDTTLKCGAVIGQSRLTQVEIIFKNQISKEEKKESKRWNRSLKTWTYRDSD